MNRNSNTPNSDRLNWSLTIVFASVVAAAVFGIAAVMISKAGDLDRRHPAVMIPAIGAFALLMVGLVAALVGAVFTRGTVREDSARLAQEPPLAQWTLTDEERRRYVEAERGRLKSEGWWPMALRALTVAGILLFEAASADAQHWSPESFRRVVILASVLLTFILALESLLALRRTRFLRKAAADKGGVRIGPCALSFAGEEFVFDNPVTRLKSVTHDRAASVIEFTIATRVARVPDRKLRIPVPSDRSEEAVRVVRKLRPDR